jgi:hypothetical protein
MPSPEVKKGEEETGAAAAAETKDDAEFKPTLWTVSTDGAAAANDADAEGDGKGKETGDGDGGDGGDDEGGAAAATTAADDGAADGAVPLSKNAQKRAKKFELFAVKKAAKKAQEKEEKAAGLSLVSSLGRFVPYAPPGLSSLPGVSGWLRGPYPSVF